MAAKVERGGICESQTPPFSERDQDRLNQPSRSQVARDPNKINRRAEAHRMFGCSLTFWSRSLQAPVQNASTNRWEALPQRNDRCRVRRPDQARSGLTTQPFPRTRRAQEGASDPRTTVPDQPCMRTNATPLPKNPNYV